METRKPIVHPLETSSTKKIQIVPKQILKMMAERSARVNKDSTIGCATWKRHLAGFLFLWHCSERIYTYRLDTIQRGDPYA